MPKYIIRWNVGYGDERKIIEVDTKEEAHTWACEEWLEDRKAVAGLEPYFSAELYTKELAIDYGLEEEEEEA